MSALPASIGQLTSLEELSCMSSSETLASLPDVFSQLRALSSLCLQGFTKLRALPEGPLGTCAALQELDLSFNLSL
jgi:hypothetical protein